MLQKTTLSTEKEIPFSGSGDYNDNSDDEDLWK